MKTTVKTYRFLFIVALMAIAILLALTVTPTYSQENPSQINDRAGFRRPTAEILQN